MIRGRISQDGRGGNRKMRDEGNINKKVVKPLHNISSPNYTNIPSKFSIFGDDIHQIVIMHNGFQLLSRRMRIKTASSFFICVQD